MLTVLKQSLNYTYTENGAWTYKSSESFCLDFFATAGALRNAADEEIIERFIRAFAESRKYAMKTLFFARDVRGGIGERRVFRLILRFLADTEPELIKCNIPIIAEYGRFDDLLVLIGTKCENTVINYFSAVLAQDIEKMEQGQPISLLAKWMPSINASSHEQAARAKIIAKGMKKSPAEYRKCLSLLRKHIDVLERRLCKVDYTFDYEKIPSKALFNYRAAFIRHDNKRYKSFLHDVKYKAAKLKTGSLYPYDIVKSCGNYFNNYDEVEALDAAWNSLSDYTGDCNALAVVDGSGSMYREFGCIRPIDVAISLGIYFAERSYKAFKNHFITFSENPRLVNIKGKNIVEKVRYVMGFNEAQNTNLLKTFALILKTAIENNLTQEDMPEILYIITDMEFDDCVNDGNETVYKAAEKLYSQYNYNIPQVVFWNVNSKQEQQPVTMHETGTALMSGMSPIIFKMVVGNSMTPYSFMCQSLDCERYNRVVWDCGNITD